MSEIAEVDPRRSALQLGGWRRQVAVILGGGWAGSSSFSLFSKRLSSGATVPVVWTASGEE